MIPKKIHYCWFGGNPLNELGEKCVESWRKYFPDYEIIEWNESNFDVNCCAYVKEAYEAKKWAFVSDYARFKILYEHGGLYFDTDVEVIKSFDDILQRGAFMGCEMKASSVASPLNLDVNPGLGLGVESQNAFYSEMLDIYHNSHFLNEDGTNNLKTIVEYTTEALVSHGMDIKDDIQFVAGIYVYPYEYFNPKDMSNGKITITDNTRSIHHFSASWVDKNSRIRGNIYRFLNRMFGEKTAERVRSVFGKKG